MKYRPEIDGLRAVAVLPVILFHAGFQTFRGGFVGVDVFFVISGYLITSIIVSEKQDNNFSLINFYERRARRILPALFLVVLVSLPFAWIWMTPNELKEFSASLAAVAAFVSNVAFWRQSDYFASAAELKPLLHTWTLAVEEQYYVLFPLFVILFWRFSPLFMIGLLAVIAAFGFALAEWATTTYPTAAFYLLPTRGWELLLGALIALSFTKGWTKIITTNLLVCEFVNVAGIALIAYAVFALDKITPFPGIPALLPTLGTAFLILCATRETLVGRFLSNKTFVGVGLISYSAYLWHQPMFAFARLREFKEPNVFLLTLLIILVFVLAFFTWRFVERPFRDKQRISKRTIFNSAGFVTAVLFGLGSFGYLNDGFIYRLSATERELASYADYKFDALYKRRQCFLDVDQSWVDFSSVCSSINEKKNAVLLWGDSHAAALSNGLRNALPNALIQYTASSCPPILSEQILWRHSCKDINDFVLREIKRLQPKTIVLHAQWITYKITRDQLSKAIREIEQASQRAKIFVLGGVPQWWPTLPEYMLKNGIKPSDVLYVSTPLLSVLHKNDAVLRSAVSGSDALFVSPIDLLCNQSDECLAVAELHGKLELMAWDHGHLTETGSVVLTKRLLPKIFSEATP